MSNQEEHVDECLGLFDEDNPRSLISIAPHEVRITMRRMDQDIFLNDERDLRKKLNPGSTLNYIRLNFWLEYAYAQENRKLMRLSVILKGVTSPEYFFRVVLKDEMKLAWVLTPPADYLVVQRDILDSALERLRQAIRIQFYTITEKIAIDKAGNQVITRTRKPNVQAIAEVRKIAEFLADRVQGAVVQKIALKAQHAHQGLPGGTPGAPAVFEPSSLDALTKQIEGMNSHLKRIESTKEETIVEADIVAVPSEEVAPERIPEPEDFESEEGFTLE